MLEENEKVNLTAITEPKQIILKHFVDSLTIYKHIGKDKKIIDVGTGAGFPGIPIKIVEKNTEMVLLDSLNKRINFLDSIIRENDLKKTYTIHARAEDAGQNKELREKFDYALSRAVAPLNILMEYMMPFVKVGGKCICMKGAEIKEEIKQAQYAINLLGGEIVTEEEFYLSGEENKRNIIIIEKRKETPKKFPRRAGIPKKEPIQG